jgi:outer membrane protein TolC
MRRSSIFRSSLLVVSLFTGSRAFGQTAAAATPPPPPQNTPATSQPPNTALLPTVDDPMLTPVPAPQQVITTWQEALNLVRSRSTDLRIAYDEVERAVAAQRVALAGALFSLTATGSMTKQLITNTQTFPGTPPVYGLQDKAGNVFGRDPSFNFQDVINDPKTSYAQIYPATSPTSQRVPSPDVTGVGTINFSQPILALRAWHQMGTARVSKEASKLSLDDVKRNLALNVANALVGVITAERVAEINRVGLQQALARLDLTTRKQRLGAATGLDVVRAQQDVESARTTLVNGDETLRRNRESLGLALGIPSQVGVSRDIKIDGLQRDAINTCKAAPEVDQRPDVAAAKKRYEVADRNINDVWLQFAPTANLNSSLGTTTAYTGSAPSTTWSITAVLTIPLWEGGARYGLLHDARAQSDEALNNLEASRRNASIQVQQARREVTVANDTLAVQARARDLAVKNDELTQAAYREGTLTSLDLVTAAAARRQAEIQYALDEFNLVQARVAAILALATCDW